MTDLSLIPKVSENALIQEVDNEVLILNRQDNEIHQLNETAALIWKECDDKHTIKDIIDVLIENYDILPDAAEKDVLDTIMLFQKNNLLEL